MQKNLYDYSTLIWSPQGRLYQVEYAMEAVNQGNLLIGLKSKDFVVLCGLKSSSHDVLSYHQEKLFKVSTHMGIGVAGLTPDGRLLHKYMKNETLNYNYVYNADYPVERLVVKIAEKSQIKTQRGESKRPFGVGLLVAGYDASGPRLFRTCPSANYYEYNCVAIGARCQTANTFLENKLDELENASAEQLIKWAVEAMKKAQDLEINSYNVAVSIVGKNQDYKILSSEEVDVYIKGGMNQGMDVV